MISLFCKHFRDSYFSRIEAAPNNHIRRQQEHQLDKLLRDLHRDDNENESFIKPEAAVRTPVELEFNCTKNEGVVTFLDSNGGIINRHLPFTKDIAGKSFSDMKVGSKLTFLLFEGSVRRIELKSVEWGDEEEIEVPDNSNAVGYTTGERTVHGTVFQVRNEGVLIVEIANDQEYNIQLKDHPQLKWEFEKGDNLKLQCIIQEDEKTWNPLTGSFGKILEVKNLKPLREKVEIGKVTNVFPTYAVIDDTVFARSNVFTTSLKQWDEYEYEAIESHRAENGRSFGWRVTKLIKKIEGNEDRKKSSQPTIEMRDVTITTRHNNIREVRNMVSVYNTSSEPVTLKTCEITSKSGLVRVERNELNFELSQNNGKFNIFLKITPRQVGSFVEELIADFGDFQKKCFVFLDIHNDDLMMEYQGQSRLKKDSRELIPGQKVRDTPRFIEIKIKDYKVKSELRQYDFKRRTDLVIDELSFEYPFLSEELSPENYVAKMRYSLYLEEIAMEIQFATYKIERGHFENDDIYLRLKVDRVAEKRPSITIGDSIRASERNPSNSKQEDYEGCIHKVEQNAILVKFHPDFHQRHNSKDYCIHFVFSRTMFKRQQHALDQTVSQIGLGFDFIFPRLKNFIKNSQVDVKLGSGGDMEINGEQYKFFNKNLNNYQKEAVVNVLRGDTRPLPYIIYGPPGTGKTSTVTECIEQIYDKIKWSRIIVAAPSNSAANLIIERLLASGRLRGGDFVRFVSFNQIEKDLIPPHLKKYCATIDIGHDIGKGNNSTVTESGLRLNCSKSMIVQYRIYISTLSSLGPLMNIKFMSDHFTHVIIDEAGQTVETESLIPISFVSKGKGQVILAGDPKQLGPIVISQIAKRSGFDKSLLERLSEHEYYLPVYGPKKDCFDPRFVTKLKKNYRSVPSVLGIYNKLFYNEELEGEISDEGSPELELLNKVESVLWNRGTADPKCGVYFINVGTGRNERAPESCSWFNNDEGSHLYLFLCKLNKMGVSMKDVGIITPYTLQVKNLKRIITQTMPGCETKVGTVEEFQGQERQVILVTTVRTNDRLLPNDQLFNLGFLQCPKRMNVAISRARALLVVFGKESVLSRDDNWRSLIKFTKEKGCYVSV